MSDMKKRRMLRRIMSILMAVMMVIGIVPADIYASAENVESQEFTVWAQGWDAENSDFTDVKYELNDKNEIVIPLSDAKYSTQTNEFEGFHFQSNPKTEWGKDNWKVEDSIFDGYQGYIRLDSNGAVVLCAEEKIYNTIKSTVDIDGEYKTQVKVGKKDIFDIVDEDNIYASFTLVFTDANTGGNEPGEEVHQIWVQGRNTETEELTNTKYELNDKNEVVIPLKEALYDPETKYFEGISFSSDIQAGWLDNKWILTDNIFDGYQGYVENKRNGQAILYAEENAYKSITDKINETGEYRTEVKFGKSDNVGSLDENNIYSIFTLVLTGEKSGGDIPDEVSYDTWIQGRNAENGELTDTRYQPDEQGLIEIPLNDVLYNEDKEEFDGIRFMTDPVDTSGENGWDVSGDIFSGGQGYLGLDESGKAVFHISAQAYAAVEENIKRTGEYNIPVRYGKTDTSGVLDENSIYGWFTLRLTGEKEEELPVEDNTVVYRNSNGREVTIKDGDTLTVNTTEEGSFTCGAYENDKNEIIWGTSWGGSSQDKPVWIGSGSGEIYVAGTGTVDAVVTRTADGKVLCNFKIVAEEPKLEEIKLYVDGEEVTNSTYEVAGRQGKEVVIKGRLQGEKEFTELPNSRKFEITSDEEFITCTSYNGAFFYFEQPGEGDITISGYGAKAVFHAKSSYVPVESIKLSLPSEVKMHHLVYSMGSGDNYMGVNQTELNECIEVVPSNSSYYKVDWVSSDNTIADYHNTHNNGFIGHKEGTVTITASVEDKGVKKSSKEDVKFVFEKPVEGISLEDGQDTLTLEEESDMTIPLVFEPNGENDGEQPSQTAIDWAFSKDGIVKIKQSRGEYDNYASKTFVLTAVSEGEVEVTGTPVCAKEGVQPVTFKVVVTESSAEPPDNNQLVSSGLSACNMYYSFNFDNVWEYTSEWDIIALKRAGKTLGRKEEDAVKSYKNSIKQQIENGKLSANSKPTDLARVALALEAIGLDASSYEGFDFYAALLNSDRIEDTSNESIWALIALDAKKTEVPKGSKYDRDKLLDAIISFQAADGGFGLSKGENTGGIDMTAMAIQALSNYQDTKKAKEATEKAVAFLQESMQSNCDFNGTSESLSQVIIAVSALGLDITEKENGFTSGKSKNVFVALLKYRDWDGFKHSAGNDDVDHMATQQAYMALASWERLTSHRNSIYDMTDVESESYPLPVITVTGAEDGQSVAKSKMEIQVSADAGKDAVDKIQVWCNDKEIEADEGRYVLRLNRGKNNLSVKAVSSRGAVAALSWTIKFAPVDYQSEINKKVTSLTEWAEKYFKENSYDLSQNKLLTTYTRTAGLNQYLVDDAVGQIKAGAEFKDAGAWSDAILFFTASGVDVGNIYGRNLWTEGKAFLTDLTLEDSILMLTAINSRYGQPLPESLPKDVILDKVVQNLDGGFGTGTSNTYDTASAVIALSREAGREEAVDKAIGWIAEHQTIDGKFSDTGSHSDLECLAKVLEALCAADIDFTLDDRFNDPANIYTNMKTYFESQDDTEKGLLYRALASYQRIYNGDESFYNMDQVSIVSGLTTTEKDMEQTAAEYLKGLDYTVYSPEATEAAYLLIRGNQATHAVYDYLDVLETAVKEKSMGTPRECFFAGLYLKENGTDLSNIEGVSLLERLFDFPYTITDSFGVEQGEATVDLSYAVLTLKLQPENRENDIQRFVQRIADNRVPDSDWQGKGFYAYKGSWMSTVEPEATIMAMTALYGDGQLADTETLVDYLGGEGVESYEKQQVENGYWADFRKSSNFKTGNLATTADMVIGLPMFGVDIRTDDRFQKGKGNILHGIRAFCRADGFADTPEGTDASAEGTVAGYRALLSLSLAEKQLPGIYDTVTERPVDRSILDEKVADAQKLVKGDYKPDTWSKLEEALTLAERAATQKEINLALEAVTNAVNGLKSNNEITVSFRLIGDWKHGKDGEHTKYVNWFKTKEYTVEKDSTVYDVFVLAMREAGLETDGEDSNYVRTVTSPAVFGSYELSEFDNGSASGWKYMVNENYPGVGLKNCRLSDGDSVIWRYIDKYTDSNDDLEKWKEAEDLEPAEIFENMRAAAKEEIAVYLNKEEYEQAQQEEASGIVADTLTKLEEAEDTVSMNNIMVDAKKKLDTLPTREELEAEKELKDAKENAKALLESYKDPTLYREEQQEELKAILEAALIKLDAAENIEDVNKTTEDTKAALDAVKTAEQLNLEELKDAAGRELSAYKNLELYREAQKTEIRKILKDALTQIEKAAGAESIAEIVSGSKRAMDAVKTAEELTKEENQAAADAVIQAINKITEPVTEAQRENIEKARKVYDALTKEQKGLVTNYEKLTAAEKAIGNKPSENESVTLKDEKYGVTLSGNKLTGSMELTVTPLDKDSQAVTSMRKEIPSTKAIFRMYEIKLLKDGKEIALPGEADLSIPVGEKYNGKELTVLFCTDGKVSKLNGKAENGTLTVKVTSLGSFSVVVDASSTPAGKDNNTTNTNTTPSGSGNKGGSDSKASGAKTGDDTPLEAMVLLMMAACLTVAAGAMKKRKYTR